MMPKRVWALMLPLDEYATIDQDKTLSEALMALSWAQLNLAPEQHYHRAILVLDKGGKVVGKLSHWAFLRSLNPEFLKCDDLQSLVRSGLNDAFIDSLKSAFSGRSGSMDALCREATRIKARDAMVPIGDSISYRALLTEAIVRMVKEHVQSILVSRDGEVVGILRLSDVFQEVADTIEGLACPL